jgi:copper chaperone NosL
MRSAREVWQGLRVLFALWLGACTPALDVPAEPVWGKQACAHCSMLVTEPPPAAQLSRADGTRLFFDDVGCLAAHLDREGEGGAPHLWVRRGEGWVSATGTRYASGARTPMDFGFLPAAEGVSWEALREAVRARGQR